MIRVTSVIYGPSLNIASMITAYQLQYGNSLLEISNSGFFNNRRLLSDEFCRLERISAKNINMEYLHLDAFVMGWALTHTSDQWSNLLAQAKHDAELAYEHYCISHANNSVVTKDVHNSRNIIAVSPPVALFNVAGEHISVKAIQI